MCDVKHSPKKKLSLFARNSKEIILVDDSSSALKYNPKNTLRISSWTGTPSDVALIAWLLPILQLCLHEADVRRVIRNANVPQ
jgi:TFIIF-interacting CTD phosphatase-like protein